MNDHQYLITGGTGFLGGYLKKGLDSRNISFDSVERKKRYANSIQADLEFDIPDFANNKYSRIVHAANLAHLVDGDISNIERFRAVNVQGTINLTKGLETSGETPNQIIYISSVSVYGLSEGLGIDENVTPVPKDPYSTSKLECEIYLKTWCELNSVQLLTLRVPLIIGNNPKGNLLRLTNAIKKGYYVSISNNTCKKSVIHAHSLIDLILEHSHELSGTYNVTDGIDPKFNTIEELYETLLGKKIYLRLDSDNLFRIAKIGNYLQKLGIKMPLTTSVACKMTSSLTFDSSKIFRATNWTPRPALDVMADEWVQV